MKISQPILFINKSILLLIIFFQYLSINTHAEVYKVPESVHFNDTELDLLGDGIRREFLLEVYEIGFYSEVKELEKLVNTAVEHPLAIRIKILSSLLPDEPPSYWIRLFSQVLNEEQFKLFTEHYTMLEAGDVLAINFRPEKGSSIYMKGECIIKLNGTEFIKVILDGFIGSNPVSTDLKKSILSS